MSLVEEVFEYNEETFWFYLKKKLAERDILDEYLITERLTNEQEEEIRMKYEEKYEEAFKHKNIEKLYLKIEK